MFLGGRIRRPKAFVYFRLLGRLILVCVGKPSARNPQRQGDRPEGLLQVTATAASRKHCTIPGSSISNISKHSLMSAARPTAAPFVCTDWMQRSICFKVLLKTGGALACSQATSQGSHQGLIYHLIRYKGHRPSNFRVSLFTASARKFDSLINFR